MTARDVIARLRFAAGKLSLSETVEVSKADLRELLTYRLIPPGQLDDESLEAAAKVADADVPDGFSWGPGNGIATAIRNLKEKPDAR